MKKIEWHFKDTHRETNRTATDRIPQPPLFCHDDVVVIHFPHFPESGSYFVVRAVPCREMFVRKGRDVRAVSSYSRLPSAAAIYATALSMMADRQTGSVGGP